MPPLHRFTVIAMDGSQIDAVRHKATHHLSVNFASKKFKFLTHIFNAKLMHVSFFFGLSFVCFDIGSALFVVASQRISAEIIAVFIIDVALPRDRLLRDALAHSCLRGRGKAIWWNCSRVKSCY